MPKISMEGATYAGHEGIVVDANDRLHEVDPSRNLDGSVKEGYTSEERVMEDRPGTEQPGVPLRGLPDISVIPEPEETAPEQETGDSEDDSKTPAPENEENSEDDDSETPTRARARKTTRRS